MSKSNQKGQKKGVGFPPLSGSGVSGGEAGTNETDAQRRGEKNNEQVIPTKTRRRFSAAFKANLVAQAERCTMPGEIGALLRREGLFASQLANWRKLGSVPAIVKIKKMRWSPVFADIHRKNDLADTYRHNIFFQKETHLMSQLNLLSGGSPEELSLNREVFRDFLRQATRQLLCQVMAEEVSLLCGRRYGREVNSEYQRGGSARGFVRIAGREDDIKRPRVRKKDVDGKTHEAQLSSYMLAQDPDVLADQLLSAVKAGVSSREAAAGASLSGQRRTGRSEVSRLWEKAGREFIDELRSRDLSGNSWSVLMLDGVCLAKDLCAVVALGINEDGKKQILDFEIGASENELVSTELMDRLYSRGYRGSAGGRFFCTLDGSKALKKAVLKLYPGAFVQRCLVHKCRNINRYMSKKHWGRVYGFFDELRKSGSLEEAENIANRLRSFLSDHSLNAMESLDEAGEDLLTFWRVGAPHELKSTLLSTNVIENSFLNVRRRIDRVNRWRPETDQPDRWMAYALITAEKGFRRIRGFEALGLLKSAMENYVVVKKKRKLSGSREV
jgi:transposase-like protein